MSASSVVLRLRQGYAFDIDFGAGTAHLQTDEPPPLGQGDGPGPLQLLCAAVGNCMSASLLFALQKFKNDPQGLTATVSAEQGRNAEGRLRVLGLQVDIRIGAPAASLPQLDRILAQFEQFCTVGQSVASAIPLVLSVYDGLGEKLK